MREGVRLWNLVICILWFAFRHGCCMYLLQEWGYHECVAMLIIGMFQAEKDAFIIIQSEICHNTRCELLFFMGAWNYGSDTEASFAFEFIVTCVLCTYLPDIVQPKLKVESFWKSMLLVLICLCTLAAEVRKLYMVKYFVRNNIYLMVSLVKSVLVNSCMTSFNKPSHKYLLHWWFWCLVR